MALDYPELLPGVFAAGASNHDSIPDTDAETGRMAWDVGFPIETSTPIATGGVPPRRLDMNGFGNRISQHVFFQQSGALYTWDDGLEYPSGAHILGSDGKEYIAIADSGPSSALGAVNPVNDVNHTAWKSWSFLLVDVIYPVGSIYMSAVNANPATLFGGVWQKIEGKFLLASSSSYALGSKGGEESVTLTANQMPVHNHTATIVNNTHSHNVTMPEQTISTSTAESGTHTHGVTFPKTTVKSASAGAHQHGPGEMDCVGTFFGMSLRGGELKNPYTGAFSLKTGLTNYDGFSNGVGAHGYVTQFSAQNGWVAGKKTTENGAHTHNVTVPATTMTTTENGNHAHNLTVTVPAQTQTSAGDTHTHSVTVNNSGGNAAVSIMPPYLTVNVWKRMA